MGEQINPAFWIDVVRTNAYTTDCPAKTQALLNAAERLTAYVASLRPAAGGEAVKGLAKCPITGREFFMNIEHPEMGEIATYGGPFDSYSIPYLDEDSEVRRERYDHDAGAWIEGGEPVGWFYDQQQDTHPAPAAREAVPLRHVAVPVALPALAVSEIKDMLETEYSMYSVKARPLWASLLCVVSGLSFEEQVAINEQAAAAPPPQEALRDDPAFNGRAGLFAVADAPQAKPQEGEDDARKAFERWVAKRTGHPLDRWADSGKYMYDTTHVFWECWQAARTPPAAPADEGREVDGMLPGALVPYADEWYRLCERRFYATRISISGELAEAIVEAISLVAPGQVDGEMVKWATAAYAQYMAAEYGEGDCVPAAMRAALLAALKREGR